MSIIIILGMEGLPKYEIKPIRHKGNSHRLDYRAKQSYIC